MIKKCISCNASFDFTEADRALLKKLSPTINDKIYPLPEPQFCPQCRHQRRLVWRVERFLHKRQCGLCKKNIVTIYPPQAAFPVYCDACFWSDRWDPLATGAPISFDRPLFDQFKDVLHRTPQLFQFQSNCVNSEYTLNCLNNKNCYLTSGADYNEDCMYGINGQRNKNCADFYLTYDCQLCYGCIDSSNLYNAIGCQECERCSDSYFLYDCKGCRKCAFSSNLRNQEHVLFNKKLQPQEYDRRISEIIKTVLDSPHWLSEKLESVKKNAVHVSNQLVASENCTGDNLKNSKNSDFCFDGEELEDCRHLVYGLKLKDCMDLLGAGWGEMMYNTTSVGIGQRIIGSSAIINSSDLMYCRCIWNSDHCFASTSLHNHNQYVILNRQYSKEEYERLVPQLIAHMQKTAQWGEFLPPNISPFEYNRSMAIDYMPIERAEALAKGFQWFDEAEAQRQSIGAGSICSQCKKEFRVIPQETKFYREMSIAQPQLCWPCRLQNIVKLRRRQSLQDSQCGKCNKLISTGLDTNRGYVILCEQCYLKRVY